MQSGSVFSFTGIAGDVTGFNRGFVPCPMGLTGTLTAEQVQWQQEIYRRAYAAALAALGGRKLALPVFGPEARN
jgi:hypothetical protein